MSEPIPFTGPGANPLALYLRGERFAIADIEEDLRDAMADAQRRINKLETRHGIGSVVRRAQLALVRRELRGVQETLWKSIGKRIRSAGTRIADAAAEAERVLQQVLFQSAGQQVPPGLLESQQAYAQRTVASYLARGQNGIGLSQRVYRTRALSNGFVDRAINRSLLQGDSWQELAARVRPMIDPGTPGGVSYAAKRLARTELNNAFHTVQRESAEANPFVRGLNWHLSRSHPRPDACDALAAAGPYKPDELPNKPHPQCLCYTTNEMMDEEEFLDLVSDPYYLDKVEEGYEQREEMPKAVGDVIELRPDPPAPKKASPPSVAQLARRKPVDKQRLGGQSAYTDLVTYADGSRLIHKVHGDRAGLDPRDQTDAETLGSRFLEVFGLRAAKVHRASDTDIWMEYIDGEVGVSGNDERQKKLLGLTDYAAVQFDRNDGGFIWNGKELVAIDNGAAWIEGAEDDTRERSKFSEYLHKPGLVDIHPEDIAEAIRLAESMRSEFRKLNRVDWLDMTLRRLGKLRDKASHTAERLWL